MRRLPLLARAGRAIATGTHRSGGRRPNRASTELSNKSLLSVGAHGPEFDCVTELNIKIIEAERLDGLCAPRGAHSTLGFPALRGVFDPFRYYPTEWRTGACPGLGIFLEAGAPSFGRFAHTPCYKRVARLRGGGHVPRDGPCR